MITSPTTGKNSKIWENGVKYFYDIAAWFPKNMVVVNKKAWNKLDGATQKMVMQQAALAERKGWQLSKMGNVADKKALADAGMEVGKVNAALQSHFEKSVLLWPKSGRIEQVQEDKLFYQHINKFYLVKKAA